LTSQITLPHLKKAATEAGLKEVYEALPGVEDRKWFDISFNEGTTYVTNVRFFQVGHIVRLVPEPESMIGPVPTSCRVCIRVPQNPTLCGHCEKHNFPPLEVWSLPEGLSDTFLAAGAVREGMISQYTGTHDFQARDTLDRMTPVEPFGMLSQDWEDPGSLPKWHAVIAWCEIKTDRDTRVTGHWELFHDAFIAALNDMRTGDEYRKSRDELKKKMRQKAIEKTRQGAGGEEHEKRTRPRSPGAYGD
jgi:hypothetical protein